MRGRAPWPGAAAVLAAALAIWPAPSSAGVTCHCFRERSYDPARPAAADPYILAVARNSLLAAASGVDKGQVVKWRMAGQAEEDLWLEQVLPAAAKVAPEELRRARSGSASWAAALQAVGAETSALGETFAQARGRGDDVGMSRALADRAIARAFGVGEPVVRGLRDAGADNAQAALSGLLARRTGRQAAEVLGQVAAGRATWGSLLASAGVAPEQVGDIIGAALAR